FLALFFAIGVGMPATVPVTPTNLTATSASGTSIALAWADNSSDETGFVVQRTSAGSTKWAKVTTTAANTHTFVNTGLTTGKTYNFRVYAINGRAKSGYSNVASATPTAQNPVNQAPTANAGADRSTPTLVSVPFSGSGSSDPDGTITSYSWSFGDGSSASGISASHSYATAGTYTVTLSVTDNGGLTASDTAGLPVPHPPPPPHPPPHPPP